MAQRGRSARETQAEVEAARTRVNRPRSRLTMPAGRSLGWLLLGLALGFILTVAAIALLPEDVTEWIADFLGEDAENGEILAASELPPTPEEVGTIAAKSSVMEVSTATVATATVASVVESRERVAPEPVSAQEAFADMFQNATRIHRVSIDDIENCRVTSQYDVKLGDVVSVEVALARKEDELSGILGRFQPYFFHIKDTSGDGVLGNHAERSYAP